MGRGRIRIPSKEAEKLLREHVARGLAILEVELCRRDDDGDAEPGDDASSAVDTWYGYGVDLVARVFSSREEAARLARLGRRRGLALSRRGRSRREMALLRGGTGYLRLLIEALGEYDEPRGGKSRARGRGRARAVIVHGPSAIAVHKLRSFVSAMGLEPVTLSALSPGDDELANGAAGCVIVLAGAERAEDGSRKARAELVSSVGAARRSCRSVVCLLEDGASLPPNCGVTVDARFRPESMDEAFTALAERLRRDGLVGAAEEGDG